MLSWIKGYANHWQALFLYVMYTWLWQITNTDTIYRGLRFVWDWHRALICCVFRLWRSETWTTSGSVTSGCPPSDSPSTAVTSWSVWWTPACWTTWPRKIWGDSSKWWTASIGLSSRRCLKILWNLRYLWWLIFCGFLWYPRPWIYVLNAFWNSNLNNYSLGREFIK